MQLGIRLPSEMMRLARRYRRILTAFLITVLTGAAALGVIGLARWRGHQALQSDTRALLTQSSQQLVRALQSRRGTLTLLRDTLNRHADMTLPQLQAMSGSAVQHTRHLLGTGRAQPGQPPSWWSGPQELSRADRAQLDRAVVRWTRVDGVWRVPSTTTVTVSGGRPLLIMLEPLRPRAGGRSAILGVFDLKPLLQDFFSSTLALQQPVQLWNGKTLLYQSPTWRPDSDREHPIRIEQTAAVGSARWRLQMQPGGTKIAQTLSWFNALLLILGTLAAVGIIVTVWLLAARAWLLQRAVERRTAALRRATQRLRQLATTDELTGLHNRRFFLERWERECERAKRYDRPLVCLMIDVNGFKQVNDRLGHQAGDLVLQRVAQELKAMLRQSDLLARLGGDEFVIALPETSAAQASLVAEKLRQISIQLPGEAKRRLPPVSLSVGMNDVGRQQAGDPRAALDAADQSLYAHKRHRHAGATTPPPRR